MNLFWFTIGIIMTIAAYWGVKRLFRGVGSRPGTPKRIDPTRPRRTPGRRQPSVPHSPPQSPRPQAPTESGTEIPVAPGEPVSAERPDRPRRRRR